MIIAVDSSALVLLINPAANPPNDPATKAPVPHCEERVRAFLASLSPTDTIVIPAPAYSEVLVRADEGAPGILSTVKSTSRLRTRPFGDRAAIEAALMTREAIAAGDKKEGSKQPWQKVKVDRQIVAIARVESADRLYADDKELVDFARARGMDVFSTWDLPLPQAKEDLFTVAGVALNQSEPEDPASEPENARQLLQGEASPSERIEEQAQAGEALAELEGAGEPIEAEEGDADAVGGSEHDRLADATDVESVMINFAKLLEPNPNLPALSHRGARSPGKLESDQNRDE